MFTNTKIVSSALMVLASVFAAPTVAVADQITLTFESNNVTLTGEFAGFKNLAYTIITDLGEINVPAGLVTCEGADCMEIVSVTRVSG